jgi:formylglycine-generating enzyme
MSQMHAPADIAPGAPNLAIPAGHAVVIENAKDGSLLGLVPGGKFFAGEPPFEVTLPAFYLGLTCVTNWQYARFLSQVRPSDGDLSKWVLLDSGCYVKKSGDGGYEAYGGREEHPVVKVSWHGAMAYCAWAGLRLPNELEWEKGARSLNGRKYPWGADWEEAKCRNDKNKGNGQTAGVWEYAAGNSEWGGYQLSGNVWEWCADWYDDKAYERYRQGDLKPPGSGTYRVSRGGSWFNVDPGRFAASCRGSLGVPECRIYFCGFRCVVDAVRSPRVGD